MTDKDKKFRDEFNQGMKEFDIAASLLTNALQAIHERLERIEQWILHQGNQRPKLTKTPMIGTVKKSPKKPLNQSNGALNL